MRHYIFMGPAEPEVMAPEFVGRELAIWGQGDRYTVTTLCCGSSAIASVIVFLMKCLL